MLHFYWGGSGLIWKCEMEIDGYLLWENSCQYICKGMFDEYDSQKLQVWISYPYIYHKFMGEM